MHYKNVFFLVCFLLSGAFTVALSAQSVNNVTCEDAFELTPTPDTSFTYNGLIWDSLTTPPPPLCVWGDDVHFLQWFRFTVTTPTTGIRFISNDLVYFNICKGSCGDLDLVDCYMGGVSTRNSYYYNLNPGEVYFLALSKSYPSQVPNANFQLSIVSVPIPANDECDQARVVVPSNTLAWGDTLQGTTHGATRSLPDCVPESYADDDVWYQFTATSARHQVRVEYIADIQGFSSRMDIEVFSGNCPQLTSIICQHDPENYSPTLATLYNLTPGETYFIRVFDQESESGTKFDIRMNTYPSSPVNDECGGALWLPVNDNPGAPCDSTLQVGLIGATRSTTNCAGLFDVWFKFTATSSAHIISTPSAGHELYSVGCDSALLSCGVGQVAYFDLVPGHTYLVRVFRDTDFECNNCALCVNTLPPPLANTDCSGAFEVTPTAGLVCANPEIGINYGGPPSSIPPCSPFPISVLDVWYKFTATQTRHTVFLDRINMVGMRFEVYEGQCDSLVLLDCVTNGGNIGDRQELVTNLLVGATYYIRVYALNSSLTVPRNFGLCVLDGPPPPPNDACADAIVLQPTTTLNCNNAVTGTTLNASRENFVPCAGVPDDDVWYSFTATQAYYYLRVLHTGTGDKKMNVEIWEGQDCNNLSFWTCIPDATNEIALLRDSFTVGMNYYIRVFSPQNGDFHTFNFSICVGAPPVLLNNISCTTADELIPDPGPICANMTWGATFSLNNNTVPGPCGGDADDSMWYSFVATSTQHLITLIPGNLLGCRFRLYKGETCQNLVDMDCGLNGYSQIRSLFANNLVIGARYFILVYGTESSLASQGSYEIGVSTPAITVPNDDCNNAILLPVATTCTDPLVQSSNNGTLSAFQCMGNADDDLWYAFYAASTQHQIIVKGFGIYNAVIHLWDSLCTTNLSNCYNIKGENDTEIFTVNNLVPGQLYKVRVFHILSGGGSFSICIVDSGASGVDEIWAESALKVYPNPANNTLFYDVPAAEAQYVLTVFNAQGQPCMRQERNDAGMQEISLSALPPGVYWVRLSGNRTQYRSQGVVRLK